MIVQPHVHKLTTDVGIDFSSINETVNQKAFKWRRFLISSRTSTKKYALECSKGALWVYPYRGIEQFNDLDTANLDFSDFPILSELMLGRDGDSNASSSFDSSDVEGATAERLVPHLVLDADSSQFISLMKVANGENVALEGPPGSGKSQTIVNAIANCIFQGKKILFSAEKSTAPGCKSFIWTIRLRFT